jgi:curved DNA-binding protein CbpA
MSYEERLGLSSTFIADKKATNETIDNSKTRKQKKKDNKEMKRAYYRASLQWHPDRWAGMSIYLLPVTSIFELISEAYTQLSKSQIE